MRWADIIEVRALTERQATRAHTHLFSFRKSPLPTWWQFFQPNVGFL